MPMRRWSELSRESRETFWRSLHAMNATRVVIAVVLLLYLIFDRQDYATGYYLYAKTCMFYLVAACVFAVLSVYLRRRFLLQVVIQIAVDIAVISTLYLTAGGARSGLVVLYLFPLGGAAILAPLVLSLFSAAIVALFLLGETLYQVFTGDRSTPLTQAGLYGAIFFALVLTVSRLAAKLIGQEELAARRGLDLSIQQAINQVIIADVEDGILVVGRGGEVFTGNPAALFMLGLPGGVGEFKLTGTPALAPIAQAFESWMALPPGDDGKLSQRAAYVTVKPHENQPDRHQQRAWTGRRDLSAHLKLRFTRVDTAEAGAVRFVIFMQDVTAIENQAQELKLASMGRLTASIAHEVRNPLSAIGHATSLLAEDLSDKSHVRLLKIVGDNVARVNRMVEDILQLSRKVQPNGEPLYLGQFLEELKIEFQETHHLREDVVWLGDTGKNPVRFDQLHLREVLVNLLTNAIRYASGAPASIRVYALTGVGGRMELHVQDDGPGITPDVRAHLFEPFYTTSNKGTGLGLYLARELCLNNDATLDYEYRFDSTPGGVHKASGRFVITFAQPVPV